MPKYEKICKTLDDTKELAYRFAKLIENDGCFINLYGEIGAGKTAFVKKVADAIGITEKVTSPSFVILNEYHSAKIPVYHFDLYRLENEGVKTIFDELQEYFIFVFSNGKWSAGFRVAQWCSADSEFVF